MTVLHLAFAGPTPEQIREADIDIANTALARRWLRENYCPLTSDDDRALEERLSLSVRAFDWRRKADLPAHPPRSAVVGWRDQLRLAFSLGAYRRNHRRAKPITTPPSAA